MVSWRNTLIILASITLVAARVHFNIPIDKKEKQQGVCWVGGREKVSEEHLQTLVDHHVTWISQTPFGWQQKKDSSSIRFETKASDGKTRGVMWGESDEGITETTRIAKSKGIKTMLKPHLWVRNSWPGEVEMRTEKDWNTWFLHYEKFILHYAALAEQNKIEIFCIGTELSKTIVKEAQWRNLIKKVRQVYNGKLIYAANFHNEFDQVPFWDALDYVGIQAYFPLTTKKNPPVTELMKGWNQHFNAIEKVVERYKKPVVFTEIGYRSTNDAAIEPWVWPQSLPKETEASEATQAVCYEAFFKSVWGKHWMAGVYFWKWYPHGARRMAELDFTPQGKMASTILKENFKVYN